MKTVGSFSSEAGAADPIAEQTREQFETEVFPAELVQIRERRAKLGQPLGKSQRPDPRLGLVGLALSGGGIRSASLALGFVQRLAQQGVLERVDYLSTVSGGGLTGACLSAVLNSPDTSTKPDRFPLGFKEGEPESSAIRHLRDHSNYLAPGGLVDKVRLPAVIFRGIVNNFAVLLPLLMLAVQLTEVFYALLYQWVNITLQMVLFVTLALFLAGILVEPVLRDFLPNRFNWRVRDGYENFISRTLLALLVITILVIPTFLLVQRAIDFDPQQQFNQNIVPRAHWILFGAIVAAVMVAMKASRSIGSTPGKVFIVVVGLSSYVL